MPDKVGGSSVALLGGGGSIVSKTLMIVGRANGGGDTRANPVESLGGRPAVRKEAHAYLDVCVLVDVMPQTCSFSYSP